MGCNCKAVETILLLAIIVFTLWSVAYSSWIVIIAAVLLLIHSMKCDMKSAAPASAKAPAKKKKK